MDYLGRYRRIVDKFIGSDFPILRGRKIVIVERDAKWRAHVNYFPWGLILYTSKKLRKFPRKSINRIIFHELCHFEIFVKQGIIKTNFIYLGYRLFSKVRKKVETDANILMIKKGHLGEVISARRGNIRRGLEYPLSEKEIKYYAEKFRKR